MPTINKSYGFTLVELVLTIILLGIFAVSIIPAIPDTTISGLLSACEKVKVDIRYAQTRATVTGVAHGFRVTGPSSYEIYNVETNNVIQSPHTQLPYQESLATIMANASFNSQNYQIEFSAVGSPSLGGGSLIQINGANNLNRQLTITASTGLITIL